MPRMMITAFVLSLLLVNVVLSVSGQRFKTPSTRGWQKVSLAQPDALVTCGFVVKQNNLDVLEEVFNNVSNPAHPQYGQYLTRDQVRNLVFNLESTSRTLEFLVSNGFSNIKGNTDGDYIRASVSAQKAGELFKTNFFHFEHSSHNKTFIKTETYTIPKDLVGHVVQIAHMSYFPSVMPRRMAQKLPESTDGYTTPSLIKSYYGITSSICKSSKSTQSLFEGLGQQYSPDDLSTFQRDFKLKKSPITRVIGRNDGSECSYDQNDCGEANLDVQYMTGIAEECTTWYWSIADEEDPFVSWSTALADYENPPLVHSISYGGYESEEASAATFNTQVQKLAVRGITVLVSSGDDGVANYGARSSASGCGYNPSFPASSPYVTAVGATQGPENGENEKVCSSNSGGLITSGGGFSTSFARPSWQDEAVKKYLSGNGRAAEKGFNHEGRGYPDVAAMGHNYIIIDGGSELVVSGTSASSPVFASIITLINDARVSAGKPPLGFLNQALYSLDSSVFNDITSGDNKCTAGQSDPVCCAQGFEAAEGWDPITGLGSPKFEKLKEALVAV